MGAEQIHTGYVRRKRRLMKCANLALRVSAMVFAAALTGLNIGAADAAAVASSKRSEVIPT